ncbi:MAG: hypothetical protein ACP5QK_07775 [Myxococcota bacterium]
MLVDLCIGLFGEIVVTRLWIWILRNFTLFLIVAIFMTDCGIKAPPRPASYKSTEVRLCSKVQ